MTITNANFDKQRFVEKIKEAIKLREQLKQTFLDKGGNPEKITFEGAFWTADSLEEMESKAADKQMEDFMFLLDFSTDGVEVLNKDLKRGDRVRVIKGPLLGLEGELVRLKGHKRVVIRLDGVASIATSYIPSSFLEKIE